MAEIGHAPADLRAQIAVVAEREDGVVVGLRYGVAVAAVVRAARVGFEDVAVDARRVPLQPGEERGPEVEGEVQVVVDDVCDAPLSALEPRRAVGAVALGGDALVPVVEGRGGVLRLDVLDPGVLARWLVEVAVKAHRSPVHGRENVDTGRSAGEAAGGRAFDW